MRPLHRRPTHPGEILQEQFLVPLNMTQVELAKRLGISLQRVNTLINGKRDMTAETALLLAHELDTTPEFWMNLQIQVDLFDAAQKMHSAA